MKIVHFINCLRGGGAQQLVELLVYEQAALGHECFVVCLGKGDEEFERKRIDRLEKSEIKCFCLNREGGSKTKALLSIRALATFIDENKPDVINSHLVLAHFIAGLACMVSKYKGIKHIATVHNMIEKWPLLYFPILRKVPHVYCSLEGEKYKGYRRGYYSVIENGIAIPDDGLIEDKKKVFTSLSLPEDALLVISVGSMRPVKNYSQSVKIISKVRKISNFNIHYIICGRLDGGDYQNIKAAVKSVRGDGWVHLLGVRDDVPEILASADCYISSALWEGLPLSVLEALFMGIPCVLSPIPVHKRLEEKSFRM